MTAILVQRARVSRLPASAGTSRVDAARHRRVVRQAGADSRRRRPGRAHRAPCAARSTPSRAGRAARTRRRVRHRSAAGAPADCRHRRAGGPVHGRDTAHGRPGVPRQDARRRAAGQRRPWAGGGHRRRCWPNSSPVASTPPSTSPIRSRCPRTTRCGDAPNLLLTPHVGGLSRASRPAPTRSCASRSSATSTGEPLINVVDGAY